MTKRRLKIAAAALAVTWVGSVWFCDFLLSLPLCHCNPKCVSVYGAVTCGESFAINFDLCPWSYYRLESGLIPFAGHFEWRTEPKSPVTHYTTWDSDDGYGEATVSWVSGEALKRSPLSEP